MKLLGMHLWFNWPLEKYCIGDAEKRALTRPEREWAMVNLMRLEKMRGASKNRVENINEEMPGEGQGFGPAIGEGVMPARGAVFPVPPAPAACADLAVVMEGGVGVPARPAFELPAGAEEQAIGPETTVPAPGLAGRVPDGSSSPRSDGTQQKPSPKASKSSSRLANAPESSKVSTAIAAAASPLRYQALHMSMPMPSYAASSDAPDHLQSGIRLPDETQFVAAVTAIPTDQEKNMPYSNPHQ
jgi:hypothetical protein